LATLLGNDGYNTYLIENGLTKEVKYYYKTGNGSWVPNQKSTLQYSGTNLVLQIHEEYYDGKWDKSKSEYDYDGNNLIQTISSIFEDGKWVESWKDIISYSGDKLDEMLTYQYYENSWEYSYKGEFSYTGDQMTKVTEYEWNRDSWEWENPDITIIKYDGNGNVSSMSGSNWKDEYIYEIGKGNLSNIILEDFDDYYGLNVFKSASIQEETIYKRHLSRLQKLKNKYPFIIK
jgi:hypothetical protein